MMNRRVLTFFVAIGLIAGGLVLNNYIDQSREAKDREVIIGILGGMGPEATVDLYAKIIRETPATRDQDHIPTLIFSNPQIPDRTKSIETDDSSIIPYLTGGVKKLENGGASFIVIPCNTAHFFYDEMQSAVTIPIVNMISEAVNEVVNNFPDVKKVGLLATTGTIGTHLYENELMKRGINVVVPGPDIQEEMVMAAVYGIKSGMDKREAGDLLQTAGEKLVENGAELILLGCTEIPLAFRKNDSKVPVVDASLVLAQRAVSRYFEMIADSIR